MVRFREGLNNIAAESGKINQIMLNIERCKSILKTNLKQEEIKELRDYLYGLARLQVENERRDV